MHDDSSALAGKLQPWLARLRKVQPLVHCITNYVTVNDVANLLLACGASPVMADAEEEAAEMAAIAGALLINLGTLNPRTVKSMHLAAASANKKGIPIVLDPVGVGATSFRSSTAQALLREHHFTLIRGNISEIKALAAPDHDSGKTRGVDAQESDLADGVQGRISLAHELARRTSKNGSNSVVVISGAQDVVAAAEGPAFVCSNGCPAMQAVTGSGCMLSALLAAYAAVAYTTDSNKEENLCHAALTGLAAMGICGERANTLTEEQQGGNASFRTHLIDSMYRLERLDDAARVEVAEWL